MEERPFTFEYKIENYYNIHFPPSVYDVSTFETGGWEIFAIVKSQTDLSVYFIYMRKKNYVSPPEITQSNLIEDAAKSLSKIFSKKND